MSPGMGCTPVGTKTERTYLCFHSDLLSPPDLTQDSQDTESRGSQWMAAAAVFPQHVFPACFVQAKDTQA